MRLSDLEIETIRAYFTDKPVLRAYLFGSYARNDAAAGSDVDILVDLDYSKHIGLGFVDMKLDLEQQLRKPVDLVSSRAITDRLRPYIDRDKTLIYDSSKRKSMSV